MSAKTKKITLYTNLYPGWQNSMFPPSLHAMPPGTYPGATPVAVEVELPLVEPDAGTFVGRVVEPDAPIRFPGRHAS